MGVEGNSMKKTVLLFCILALFLLLSACEGATHNADIHIGASTMFSEFELQSAADAVLVKFKDFYDCDLQKLWYDETVSASYIEEIYMVYGKGSVNGADKENVIILMSEFYVGENACVSLNRNSMITHWRWILIRASSADEWIVDDWGYSG